MVQSYLLCAGKTLLAVTSLQNNMCAKAPQYVSHASQMCRGTKLKCFKFYCHISFQARKYMAADGQKQIGF